MARTERKIEQLEYRLQNLKLSSDAASNCGQIARLELQLAQLYNISGNKAKAEEMINDAEKVLEDPTCPRTRQSDAMLRYVKFYKENPAIADVPPLPAIYRYLSLIILGVGYFGLYMASILIPSFPTNYYFFGILGIFVISMAVNSLVRSKYNREIRSAIGQPGPQGLSEDEIKRLQEKIKEDQDFPNPERILDAAKSEITIATIYLKRRDYSSAQTHLSEANRYLNDPLCEDDQEKENLIKTSQEIQSAINGSNKGNGFQN